ncbi:MAG: MFS transporter [Candidatus Hodarchaeaceae archaeon]|nr:MFS transporter [Candidatus Hodarchaeaceae archaeon]
MSLKLGKTGSDYRLFRWGVLATGFTINACLGILYAWSVFIPTLEEAFGWTRTEVALPFVIATLSFSFGMIFTGRLQDRPGPRTIALCGAALAGGGYMLSSLAESLPHLLITYGLIAGLGNAAGYIAAVSAGLKWFPDKRGLASGIVVGGYGLGAFVFAPVATHMIAVAGWRMTFTILGLLSIFDNNGHLFPRFEKSTDGMDASWLEGHTNQLILKLNFFGRSRFMGDVKNGPILHAVGDFLPFLPYRAHGDSKFETHRHCLCWPRPDGSGHRRKRTVGVQLYGQNSAGLGFRRCREDKDAGHDICHDSGEHAFVSDVWYDGFDLHGGGDSWALFWNESWIVSSDNSR